MKINMKQTAIFLILLVLLSACGSSDNDDGNKKGDSTYNNAKTNNNTSTTIFKPSTASEFETKFVNKKIQPPSGNTITILPNSRIRQTITNGEIGEGTYTYKSGGYNTAVLTYKIGDIDCIVRLSWTSELGGNIKEEYISTDFSNNANGTFFINGKN